MGSLLDLALLQIPRYTVEAKSIQALRKLFVEVQSQAMTPSFVPDPSCAAYMLSTRNYSGR
jgi:hypothetical protein